MLVRTSSDWVKIQYGQLAQPIRRAVNFGVGLSRSVKFQVLFISDHIFKRSHMNVTHSSSNTCVGQINWKDVNFVPLFAGKNV